MDIRRFDARARGSLAAAAGLLIVSASAALWADPPRNQLEATTRRGIWDNNMTQGVTGLGWEIPDKGSSEGKSGIPKEERLYYIPSHGDLNRLGDEVDRRELENAGKTRRYSPEALLQCQMDWRAGTHALNKGYYLVSLDDDASGSARVHGAYYQQAVEAQRQAQIAGSTSGAGATRAASGPPAQTTLVLKRQGRVAAVLPIDRVSAYDPQPGEPSAKRPFARIERTEEGSILRFYYKNRAYGSPLTATPAVVASPVITPSQSELPPLIPH